MSKERLTIVGVVILVCAILAIGYFVMDKEDAQANNQTQGTGLSNVRYQLEQTQVKAAEQAQQLEQLKDQLGRTKNTLTRTQNTLEQTKQQLADAKTRFQQSQDKVQQLTQQRNSLQSTLQQSQQKCQQTENELQIVSSQRQALAEQVGKITDERDRAVQDATQTRVKLTRKLNTTIAEQVKNVQSYKQQIRETRAMLDEIKLALQN